MATLRRLKGYVTVFLFRRGRVLLLERSQHKRFAPGLWTGVGGRVQSSEMADLEVAALREVQEETGLSPRQIGRLTLRVVETRLEGIDIATIFFYEGETDEASVGLTSVGPTEEGTLHWMDPKQLDDVPLIPNARRALNVLLTGDSSNVVFSGHGDGLRQARSGR